MQISLISSFADHKQGVGNLALESRRGFRPNSWKSGNWLSRLSVSYCPLLFLDCRRWYIFPVYLIHWPVPLNPNGNHPMFPVLPDGKRDVDLSWKLADTWKQMEALVKTGTSSLSMCWVIKWRSSCVVGKVRSIGVSNFSEMKLKEILPTAEIIPVVNQANFLSPLDDRPLTPD